MLNVVIGQYSFVIPPTSNRKYSGEEYAEMIRRRFDNPQSFEAAKYAAENIAYIYRKGSVIHYITVHAKHHDGTNVFELHLLTDEGYQEYEDAYDAWNYDNAPKPQLKSEWFEKILFNKIF